MYSKISLFSFQTNCCPECLKTIFVRESTPNGIFFLPPKWGRKAKKNKLYSIVDTKQSNLAPRGDCRRRDLRTHACLHPQTHTHTLPCNSACCKTFLCNKCHLSWMHSLPKTWQQNVRPREAGKEDHMAVFKMKTSKKNKQFFCMHLKLLTAISNGYYFI